MKTKIYYFVGLVVIMSFYSCKPLENELISVRIDFDNVAKVDINQGKIIEFETNDSSLLYEINNVDIIDNKIIVQTRGKSIAFNLNGKYLFNVGVKGDAPNEYKKQTGLFVKDKFLNLFDGTSKKILRYNEEGDYMATVKIATNSKGLFPTTIYPLRNGNYISKNTFQGDSEKTPTLSLLDDQFENVYSISGRYLKTGFVISDNFFQYKDDILYWETLNDTIFAIENYKKISPKYFVDFNKYAIPNSVRKGKDVYDLIEYTNKPENLNSIATFVRYVSEDEHFLRFIFVYNHKIHYTKYYKELGISKTFSINDNQNNYTPTPFLFVNGNKIYISLNSTKELESNPLLVVFDDSIFE